MAQDRLTGAAQGSPSRMGTGQVNLTLAGIVLIGGAMAEATAPGPVTLLTGADFAVGACYAAVGIWLLRAGRLGRDAAGSVAERGADRLAADRAGGWLALAVSAAWFCGTAAAALPTAVPSYGAAVAVLGYRAMLTHLLFRGLDHWRTLGRRADRGARLAIAAVEPPPAAGPGTGRVTRVPAPGGGEVALIGGPAAGTGSALSRAAAVAAALALENARISAEVRDQAEAVRESPKRLLTVADEERQALAARLRAGPGEHLQKVDQLLAGLDGESARDIRSQLASAVADLEQLALGLFPATLGSRPVQAAGGASVNATPRASRGWIGSA